jgi:hypothetical protein
MQKITGKYINYMASYRADQTTKHNVTTNIIERCLGSAAG